MDDEDLSLELVEWLSQKKSEWLGAIIAHQPQDDLNFDQLHHYGNEVVGITQDYDEMFSWKEDKYPLKTFLKFLPGSKLTVLVVVAIVEKDNSFPVFYFATHYRSVADLFCKGEYSTPLRQ